jgi:hypothetical protein
VDEAEAERETTPSETGAGAKVAAVFIVLGVLAGAGVVFYRIYPSDLHEKSNPGFLDNVFGSDLVIFASRLVLLSAGLVLAFAGVYLIVSMVSWMRHKQWLSEFGPFKVSREAIEQLQVMAQFWQEQATQQANEVQQLQQQLAETTSLLNSIYLESQPEGGFDETDEADNI